MNRGRTLFWWIGLVALLGMALPVQCPAPLVWRKGEGWAWERGGQLSGATPKEQLEIAQQLQAQQRHGDAIAAYRRLIRRWPTALATQNARLGLAECLSTVGYHYKAFLEYQNLISRHPNSPHFELALQRQLEIGKLFLSGTKHKVWGMKWFDGLERATEVFEQVVKNGPFGNLAPEAQFSVGLVHVKQREYLSAVRAFEKTLEKYPKHPIAATAQFEIGLAYRAEAGRAEYDQNAANQAVASFTDFLVKYPKDERQPQAEQYRAELRQEQARGLFRIAQYYQKEKKPKAAMIYYNEVIEQNPNSEWAAAAQQKITELTAAAAPAPTPEVANP